MLHTTAICRLALLVCASTAVPIGDTTQEAAESVVLEINQERVARQLPRLAGDPRLTLAAGQHARDMARRGYFSHVTPEGRGMTARVRATGYLRDAARWSLGLVLGTPFALRRDGGASYAAELGFVER